MEAARHPREAARLAALRRYQIAYAEPDRAFDEVAALASRICEVPVSLVTFIEADRQWFKAAVGTDLRETAIDQAICGHAILEGDFLEIADTRRDARTRNNALCQGEHGMQFYAGVVLKTAEGLPLGTLCVLDARPRELTDLQRETLRVLAGQVMRELDLREALRRQELLRREIDHRVKNSLQSVAALVRLERSRSPDPHVADALERVSGRITAVAAVHEALQEADTGETIAASRLLERLAELLAASLPAGVTMCVTSVALEVDSARASALGMLVNEFVANAARHGFGTVDARGTIAVTLAVSDGDAVLTCEDDGQAEPHGAASSEAGASPQSAALPSAAPRSAALLPKGTGLGRRIVQALVRQLGGTLEEGAVPGGYRLEVRFPAALPHVGEAPPASEEVAAASAAVA